MNGIDDADPPGIALMPGRHLSGVLHGRRQGRRLRDTPTGVMERLLPLCAFDLARLSDPASLFAPPRRMFRLEVGFGGGEHLHAQAGLNPDVGFIGCEPFRNGVASLMQHLEGDWRPNLRVHPGDAGEVIDALPPAVLSRVDLLYPDPWPKRRQRKRRFVSDAMLGRLARVMRPGGIFRFATDIDDYAGWTLAHVLRGPDFVWQAERSRDWREPWADWVPTRYESKAKRQGREPVYLTFSRR